MKASVVVAMSGGVDSSTAACLLSRQGYKVIGVSLRLFAFPDEAFGAGCCGHQGIDDARSVCQKIGAPFYVFNYERQFDEKVIKYFCQEYENGRTPNPCIICNEKIKLGSLLEKAKGLDAAYLATGHYARLHYLQSDKRYLLKKGRDKEKEQSYFLFSLSQEQLRHCLFPLGNYRKNEVRKMAKEFGLKVHNKAASQEICFIPDNDYRRFLKRRIPAHKFRSGPIINQQGKILGEHQGIAFYTIGQRKGIGAHKRPFYVLAIDQKKNAVVVGEEKELYQDTLEAEKINWLNKKLAGPLSVKVKIRYKHRESQATVFPLGEEKAGIKFRQPQRAITPGQAVVFYKNDTVIGGGWISARC